MTANVDEKVHSDIPVPVESSSSRPDPSGGAGADVGPDAALEVPSEYDRLDPPPKEYTLTSGTTVELLPLKSRSFFKLLRIITRGGSNVLSSLRLSADMEDEQFVAQLLALVVFAVPESEEEAITFLKSMVQPKGLTGNDKVDDQAWLNLYAELQDPELDDLVGLIECIVLREAKDLKALGNRLRGLLRVAEKTGQLKTKATAQTTTQTDSLEASAARST